MSNISTQFGNFEQGRIYVDRPVAYGIALGKQSTVLIVTVGTLLALPGGGLEKGETIEKGLKREFREETGYVVQVLRYVGGACQYVHAQDNQTYYNKICQFFEVELIGESGTTIDVDHQIRWLPIAEASALLSEEAHRWAVAKIANG